MLLRKYTFFVLLAIAAAGPCASSVDPDAVIEQRVQSIKAKLDQAIKQDMEAKMQPVEAECPSPYIVRLIYEFSGCDMAVAHKMSGANRRTDVAIRDLEALLRLFPTCSPPLLLVLSEWHTSDRFCPLHVAASGQCRGATTGMMALLKVDGVNVNARCGTYQWTPLHIAAAFGNVEAVRALMGHGRIEAWVRTGVGHTPLDVAVVHKRLEVVEAMVECEEVRARTGMVPGWDSGTWGRTALAVARVYASEERNGERRRRWENAVRRMEQGWKTRP